jgi:DNA-binding response OmpR family regulator
MNETSSLSTRLGGEGYVVDTAADVTESFPKAISLPFDPIILDRMAIAWTCVRRSVRLGSRLL